MAKQMLYFHGRRILSATARKVGDFIEVEPISTRTFDLKHVEATWATFAAIDLSSVDQTLYFLTRYGAPYSSADEPASFSTKDWVPLQRLLQHTASVYEPGKDGVYYPGTERSAAARALNIVPVSVTFVPGKYPIPDFRVSRLADHLHMSATAFLNAGIPMRRCSYCSFFISADHERARFCNAACRNSAALGRRAPVRIG